MSTLQQASKLRLLKKKKNRKKFLDKCPQKKMFMHPCYNEETEKTEFGTA